MKTKLYKLYSNAAKDAKADAIFIDSANKCMFAHAADCLEKKLIAERHFSWSSGQKRSIRLFETLTGDVGLRYYDTLNGGTKDDKWASHLFTTKDKALEYFDLTCKNYLSSPRLWEEVEA